MKYDTLMKIYIQGEEICIFIAYAQVYSFLGIHGETLGMSGDQVGMNGDGRGEGVGGTNKRRIFMDDSLKTNGLDGTGSRNQSKILGLIPRGLQGRTVV